MFDQNHFNQLHFIDPYFTDFGEGGLIFNIGGRSALKYLKPSTLNIKQSMNNRTSGSFVIVGKGGYAPKIGEEVIIEYSQCKGESFKRIFGGHIKNVRRLTPYCGKTVMHQVTIVDYNALLDKRLVFNIYEAQPVQQVILDIVRDYLEGERITTNGVNAQNLTLAKAVFSYVKASKAFNDIANNAGLFWYIDYYRDLKFFVRSSRSTSATLSPDCGQFGMGGLGDFCAFINSEACNEGIRSSNIQVEDRQDQLVNFQYVIAGKDETPERVEKFVGDGERQTFSLKYQLSTLKLNEDLTIAPDAIQLDLDNQSVGVRDDDEPTLFDWYFEKGENVIVQNDDATPITSGQVLQITYKGLRNVVIQEFDKNSVNRIANIENDSGKYMDVEDDESIESKDFARDLALGRLRRFKDPKTIISYKTDVQTLELGDIVSVTLPDYAIDSPDGYMVSNINIVEVESKILHYEYSLDSSDNSEGWQEYFRKIEFFGRQLKLRQQKSIIVHDKSEEGLNITQEFSFSLGSGDLEAQQIDFERCWMHSGSDPAITLHKGRAFVNHAFHCVPQVVKLGLN